MKNTINDLRNHLFATLEELMDKDVPVDKERTKLLCSVSANIINSAKVEVDYMRLNHHTDATNKFFEQKQLN